MFTIIILKNVSNLNLYYLFVYNINFLNVFVKNVFISFIYFNLISKNNKIKNKFNLLSNSICFYNLRKFDKTILPTYRE